MSNPVQNTSPNTAEQALITRWESFVQKTETRFQESLQQSTEMLVQQLQETDYDYNTTFRTWQAVKDKIFALIDTIGTTWKHKVEPLMKKEGDAWVNVRDSVSSIENRLHNELEVYHLSIQGQLAERTYNHLLPLVDKDYFCTQCGAPIRIKTNIFRAQYITCNACNTTNTIDLETKFVFLLHNLDDIAAYRSIDAYKAMQNALSKIQDCRPPAPDALWQEYETTYYAYHLQKLDEIAKLKEMTAEEMEAKKEKIKAELTEYINIQKHNKYGKN